MKPSEQADYCEIIKKDVDQAIQEILALLPKKKEIKELKSKPCPYSEEIKCCTMQDYARNQCIDEMKQKLEGENG